MIQSATAIANPVEVSSFTSLAKPARASNSALLALAIALVGSIVIFGFGTRSIYGELLHPCMQQGCSPLERGAPSGISQRSFAWWFIARDSIPLVSFAVMAVIMLFKAGSERIVQFGAFAFVFFGSVTPDGTTVLADSSLKWRLIISPMQFLGTVGLICFCALFPDGRLISRWSKATCLLILISCLIGYSAPEGSAIKESDTPFVLVVLACCVMILISQIDRYRHYSTSDQRSQTKWVLLGAGLGLAIFFVAVLVIPFLHHNSTSNRHSLTFIFGSSIGVCGLMLIPVSVGFAMIRFRLWEVDRVINRALVYGLLTLFVGGAFLVTIVVVSSVLNGTASQLVTAIATGFLALALQPLHRSLQRRIDKLIYGYRGDPYSVISELGRRLEQSLAPEELLHLIVGTVASTFQLPYASIDVFDGEVSTRSAHFGQPTHAILTLPLSYHDQTIGRLQLTPPNGQDNLSPSDHRLLRDIAVQAGVALHSIRVNLALDHANRTLTVARDDERRRLRQDLHDGLGPQLASQTLTVDAARTRLRTDPEATDQLLYDLQEHIQHSIADVRRLIDALRPIELDELGLMAAIRRGIREYAQAGIAVQIQESGEFGDLPEALELAAYRITQEALTNVVRHSKATSCHVRCSVDRTGAMLTIDIEDNGVGLPEDFRPGVGHASMRARAEANGGDFSISPAPGGGTIVRLRLPVPTS
jgi:signal transduction histidine kinase